jgi:hypothetical protein
LGAEGRWGILPMVHGDTKGEGKNKIKKKKLLISSIFTLI